MAGTLRAPERSLASRAASGDPNATSGNTALSTGMGHLQTGFVALVLKPRVQTSEIERGKVHAPVTRMRALAAQRLHDGSSYEKCACRTSEIQERHNSHEPHTNTSILLPLAQLLIHVDLHTSNDKNPPGTNYI